MGHQHQHQQQQHQAAREARKGSTTEGISAKGQPVPNPKVLAAQLIDRLENHRKVQLRREHNFEISINETGEKVSMSDLSVTKASALEKLNEEEGEEERTNREESAKVAEAPDILSKAAMHNAYFICHNVQDLMFFRGFTWDGAGG